MRIDGPALKLSIYIGESDHWDGRPLHQVIVERLRAAGIAGATVLRGIEGYGRAARVHTAQILRLSEDLPILIEVVDREDRLRAILPEVDAMVEGGLVTLEHVEVIAYRAPAPAPAPGPAD